MSNRVVHFEIQADDIKRAKAFYEKTFGWKIDQMMTKEKGGMDYWGLTTGKEGELGINGGMYERPKDKVIKTYDCTINVENIDKAVADIKMNGGTITQDKMEIPGVGIFASALDTEGNKFGVIQPTGWTGK